MAKTASKIITRKIALTTALVTACRGFGAALDLQPFVAADEPDDHRGERRLDDAGHEVLEVDHARSLSR